MLLRSPADLSSDKPFVTRSNLPNLCGGICVLPFDCETYARNCLFKGYELAPENMPAFSKQARRFSPLLRDRRMPSTCPVSVMMSTGMPSPR
jgi:hypothetical protein